RGCGEARWDELVAAARKLVVGGDVPPKLLGGLAFAPGAADRAPWTGFGDAWFVLPRWTYSHDGSSARLVLAVDAGEALQAARWERLVAKHGSAIGCDALAGSHAPRSEAAGPIDAAAPPAIDAAAALLASGKDRREHELVVRAIRAALAELGADVDAPAEPVV